MSSVRQLRQDYNNRLAKQHQKRNAAIQAIFTGSAVLTLLATMYMWAKVYVAYGFWIPTLVIVAIVMLTVYVSGSRND